MNRCTYDTCPKPAIVRQLCEQHYLVQFVQPLQKERRNSEELLLIINTTIASHVQELYKAKHPNGEPSRLLRQRPDGAYTNSAMVFCHKCWKGFEGAIDCIQHEEDCQADRPKLRREASGKSASQSNVKDQLIDDGEVVNDI